ncbi:MAG: hypothetical protein WCW03_03440 [Candidatus Paceibacterota bacterium]|jgi:hypothetical protein
MEQQIKGLKSPLPLAIIIAGTIIAIAMLLNSSSRQIQKTAANSVEQKVVQDPIILALEEVVIPSKGVTLPISWGVMGKNLIKAGVIRGVDFQALYADRGAFTEEDERLLFGTTTGNLVITRDNAGVLLNLFWALGLAQKNSILEKGEMMDPKYGGAGNFASTGGWTLAQGDAMAHYSYHMFFTLTSEQQALVEKVSRGIYRPCCGNSVHFPDCNHGMAMLGLLELMASQGATEEDMWNTALAVNSYWFPDTYVTIAMYMKNRGVEWTEASPQEILGANYSSSLGYAKIATQVVKPQRQLGGNGCGVDAGQSVPVPTRQQSGCAI